MVGIRSIKFAAAALAAFEYGIPTQGQWSRAQEEARMERRRAERKARIDAMPGPSKMKKTFKQRNKSRRK